MKVIGIENIYDHSTAIIWWHKNTKINFGVKQENDFT